MSRAASWTLAGVSRLAAPRWSAAPHSDGHHVGPIGVGCGAWQRELPTRASAPAMHKGTMEPQRMRFPPRRASDAGSNQYAVLSTEYAAPGTRSQHCVGEKSWELTQSRQEEALGYSSLRLGGLA